MACGRLSNRVAALAAAAACLAAAAPVPQRSCEAEGGRCPSAAEELDESDQASLLVRATVAKAHDHAAAAAAPARVDGKAKCNEAKFQGLCYRTCTDMGEMEPRTSPSTCGGVSHYSFIQRCNEDGSSSGGAGSAPGISGRSMGGCFGDESASLPSPDAPNMCTQDCGWKTPTATAEGSKKKWCCTDGKTTPEVYSVEDETVCSCSLGKKPPMKWMPEPEGVLKTPVGKPCNLGCSKARAHLMFDGIAYCCPGGEKPAVTKLPGGPDYTVKCSCSASA